MKKNIERIGCKDVFHAFLVEDAEFEGELEIPCIKEVDYIPNKFISFSRAIAEDNHNQWVHFYEDDVRFERLWNRPNRYLPILKKFNGVITPDFSVYRDMPLIEQQWNIYRSRAIGHWLQKNEVPVITNVRWGDERTFELSCVGVPTNSIIAVGSHGCIKNVEDKKYFIDGLDYVVKRLAPKTLVVYGTVPDSIFEKY